MKSISLLFILPLFTLSTYAQINFDKDTMSNPFVNRLDFDYSQKAYLTNNANDENDTLFTWQVISLEQPEDWELTVCTEGECISDPAVNVVYPFILPVGEKEEFKIGWSLFEIGGEGIVSVEVKSRKYENLKDTVTLNIATLANIKKTSKPSFTIYPNPVKDKFAIQFSSNSSKTIRMFDILGNEVLSKKLHSNELIDITSFSQGVYILKIDENSGYSKIIQKK